MSVSMAGVVGALEQMIASAQSRLVGAKRDLQVLSERARGREMTADEMYHQGYCNGRVAELEQLVESLQLLMRSCR